MNPYKVAVIEDEELISTMIKVNLSREGYKVSCMERAEQLIDRLQQENFDIILLDIMLPGISGEEAVQRLRQIGILAPIMMITAKHDIETKVKTLGEGADDYLTKPFSVKELLARVKALIRRSKENHIPLAASHFRIGDKEIDFQRRIIHTSDREIPLSDKEARTLQLFISNPGKNIARETILEEVWEAGNYPSNRVIDNLILKFRKIFEDNPNDPRYFKTVHSLGYRLEI